MNKYINFIKKDFIQFSYFVISLTALTFFVYDKYFSTPIEKAPQVQMVKTDENTIRLNKLESTVNDLVLTNDSGLNNLMSKLESAVIANQQLEKKLQTQLEFNKRLCEYIVVITVDKKILPRQCLSGYNWFKE